MGILGKSLWLALLVGLIMVVSAVSPQLAKPLMQLVESVLAAEPNAARGLLELTSDRAEVAQAESIEIDVIANDTMLTDARLLAVSDVNVGSVTVANGKAVYTAPAGFQGVARFTYMAKGSPPGPPGRGQVVVAVGTRLSIEGAVYRASQEGARVTLAIGGREYATTTDVQRGYRFDVLGFDDAAVAVLKADGLEANTRLHLESFLGTIGRIKRKMGADGVLTRNDDNAVLVSFLSSALMIHAQAANDDTMPASDAQYEAAVLASLMNSMLETASFMHRVDAGQYKLREWSQSAFAFVSRPGAAWAYPQDDEERQLGGFGFFPMILETPEQFVSVTGDEFARPLTLIGEAIGGGVQDSIRVVQLIEPQQDGRVNFVDGIAKPVQPMTLSLDGPGETVFTPAAGDKHIVRELNVRVNGAFTKQLQVVRRREMYRMFDGAHADLMLQFDTLRTEFPSFPERDFDGAGAGRTWVAYEHLPQLPYIEADVPARMAMAYFCPRETLFTRFGYCDYQIHRLTPGGQGLVETAGPSLDGAGNPRARADGGAVSWSLDAEGRLTTVREGTTMTHQRLAQENGVAESILSVGTATIDGRILRIAHLYQGVRVPADGSATPVPEMLGQWDGSLARLYPLDYTRQFTQTYRFDSDATGVNNESELGEYTIGNFAWQLDPQGLLLKSYLVFQQLPGTPVTYIASENRCTAASGNCRVRFQRLIPLATANGKAYFQEEIYDSTGFPAVPLARTATRPTAFYRM